MKITKFVLLSVLLLLVIAPVGAQDANPLLEMLALVPYNEMTLESPVIVSYADYAAAEAARGISRFTKADVDEGTDLFGLWMGTIGSNFVSGMEMSYFQNWLEEMPQTVGFAWTDIDRTLEFGQPPAQGHILAGDFDADSITAAFSARGFVEAEVEGVPVWCPPAGCEEGMKVDVANRELGNPFGGEIGRKEPFAMLSEYLVDAPDFGIFQSIIAAYNDTQDSLADVPEFVTAVEAIASKGVIRQAQFVGGLWLITGDPLAALPGDVGDLIREAAQDYGTIPPYSLVVFADVAHEDEQRFVLGFVYPDAESAQAAGAEVINRLKSYVSLTTKRPVADMLEERGVSAINEPEVYEGEDFAVALITMPYPYPSNELVKDGGREFYAPSGMVFRLFVDMLYRRDTLFLVPELLLPEQ
jgi:hypothetical protein